MHKVPVSLLALLVVSCATTPPYFGWTADQLYQHGERALEAEDWVEAQRAFERLVLSHPGYGQAVQARHHLARAHYERGEYLSAVGELTRIVQVYPDDPRTPRAWLWLCHSYAAMSPHPQRDQQYTMQARNTCGQVAGDLVGTPMGDSAAVVAREMIDKLGQQALAVGQFYFQRRIYGSAEHVFRSLLEDYSETTAAPTALMRLIEIYEDWGWDDQRQETSNRLLRQYPQSPEARALTEVAMPDSVARAANRGALLWNLRRVWRLAARGQPSHGIRAALNPRWTASLVSSQCNV